MRTGFHALLMKAGKDKVAIKKMAGEQAGFSSEREVICRNYLGEEVHGFCALRITQARALALQTAFEERTNLQTGSAKTTTKRAVAKQKPMPNLNSDAQQTPQPGSGPH